ncbi:hypothetical protein HCN44_006721 [Aphidius gifuensis]|uniref:Retinoblastoma-like protein 1 n=1 Tax=Aphidius gifuensis TaxID=684658 RepID=A0A835CU01_APHGI|nr:retinoblastoma-like protein 1 [Aphidius gifuensis]KAF7995614.1 hypothetical protein HCN44_006721 [Aphidius gifuensis]
MSQGDDGEDSTYNRHLDLCQELNMDAKAASKAWKSYSTIRQNYTLEGDQIHWLGCALYVACRESSTPTVGRPGSNVEGNLVSLTRLLHLCKLSLIPFFTKCKLWSDMANIPPAFCSKMAKLERNFSVSMVIFQKFQPLFDDIFKSVNDDDNKPSRSRRHRAAPCTVQKAFEFCWTLFICVKAAFPDISDDLVNSYHLLLVCCDFIYNNAFLANRKDLLNPNFIGLPSDFHDENFTPPKIAPCILDIICERYQGIIIEAKVIKEYSLRAFVIKFFDDKILRGDPTNLSGLLEALYFDGNNRALNRTYEQHVLSVGDFDERIFLGPNASENIGSPTKMLDDLEEQFQLKREQMRELAPPTPLTGRKYLRSKDNSISGGTTPVATATQSVIRLHALVAGRSPAPSDILLEMYKNCSTNVQSILEKKIKEIGELFCSSYTQGNSNNDDDVDDDDSDNNEGSLNIDFGKKRLMLGQTLFYKLLEIILTDEKRIKPDYDITNLLTNEIFLQCLFGCCLEIVIWSYKNKDRTFPWILNALKIEPYNFYKVIEVIVRAEQLSRDVVKHLNDVEEKILESQAWQSNSPLWQAIENTRGGVPSCEEVSLPGMLDAIDPNTPGQPVLRRIALDRGTTHHDSQQSPLSSASERFQSPVTASGIAKKRLFNDTSKIGGQSLLKDKCSQKILTDGSSKYILTYPDQQQHQQQQQIITNRDTIKPKKTGSVALFFRKFYILGSVRMQNLCSALSVNDIDLKKKIWTIFEFSIQERTDLMKDRHLDQILMCAVYVVCKLAKIERNTFTEIMRCYRFQPQAESHIYRSVLISKNSKNHHDNETDNNTDDTRMIIDINNTNNVPTTPTNMAGTSQTFGDEIRGDLIKFYNSVYVPQVKEFAIYSRGSNPNVTLSPLPKCKPSINTPVRRVTSSLMTRTLDPKAITASPAPQLSYCFSRSPAKDLEAINRMMISVDSRKTIGKRLLSDDMDIDSPTEGLSPIKKNMTASNTSFFSRKLENIMGERRTQNQ